MFELSESLLKNKDNLLLYTSMLEKKLNLLEQKISIIAAYKRTHVEISALIGETQ